MIALRPRDQNVWDSRPVSHETEAETKTNYAGLETLTSLYFVQFMRTTCNHPLL